MTAWERGTTGQGVTIGIVDTGIDTSNPEFAGRISAASADVAGTRSVQGESDHGTYVALVAAAARNGTGIVGIAYQATILALRADAPGTCASTAGTAAGCRFGDGAIAAGVDRAVQGGAKVVNLSLGGGGAGAGLRATIGQAAAADVVVVVSAGNDADAAMPSSDPNNPDPFAVNLREAGNGNVIIAGSVGATGMISAFSNRAGTEANSYLTALGERICCVYENGAIQVTERDGQQFVRVISGTSFSAPQIAGAAALLRQAFPNLTAAQTVDLLLRSARDAGAAGTDAIYGRGILDMAGAFAPQGQTTLAGTKTALALTEATGIFSPAMGDAGQSAALNAIVLDDYGRAFGVDLGGSLRGAHTRPRLASTLTAHTRNLSTAGSVLTFAAAVDGSDALHRLGGRLPLQAEPPSRVLSARMIAQVRPDTRLGFSSAGTAFALAASLRQQGRPEFLLAGDTNDDQGFILKGNAAFGIRRQLGAWGLTVTGERGQVRDDSGLYSSRQRVDRKGLGSINRVGAQIDRRFGWLDMAVGTSWLDEQSTVLGARFNRALAPAGATSLFLDFDATVRPGDGWLLGGALRRSWTRPRTGGLLAAGSELAAQAWSIDLARDSVFMAGDSLALRLSQPMRIVSGGLLFDLPTAYDYATLTETRSRERLSLVPRGRETMSELAWRGALWGGSASTSLYYRKDPGNFADAPDDAGVAVTWARRF